MTKHAQRQTQLFTKTRKQGPSDEVARNAQLLIRAGYLHKEQAGVYSFLPLGLRVLQNINTIIREEMDAIGGQELQLSTLQDKQTWEKSGRWSDDEVDVWFKTTFKNETETGLGWTHEEPITAMMKNHIHSYRDLPQYAYQIQTKFRNEIRAKSGIMRTREFPMKDLYSFNKDQEGLDAFYEHAAQAYMNVFNRVGIGERTYKTFASGGAFAKYSHEFQTMSEAGEDIVYLSKKDNIAINKEVYSDAILKDLGIEKSNITEEKAIEVGNIFKLGTRFSEAFGLLYTDENGDDVPVVMGSYGIGPSRLMGTIAEVCADEKGIVWPHSVAPYRVHLIRIGEDDKTTAHADALFETFQKRGIDVLYDDRDVRAGEKFTDSDLLGMPLRVIISEKTLNEGKVEVIERTSGDKKFQTEQELLTELEQ